MNVFPEGNAIVYCEGALNTPNGKSAHGVIRHSRRYRVLSVIDSRYAGRDAGDLIDGRSSGIPVLAGIDEALEASKAAGEPAGYMVIGIAPDGGRLSTAMRADVLEAVSKGLNLDSGLHDFLSEDREIAELAARSKAMIRDIRKPPPRSELHFFSGKIEEVTSLKVAVLGTDSAIGKRTTAWLLVKALEKAGYGAELIGTGQTAWMQGVKYGIVLDSIINDFVTGEIEHAVWSAWRSEKPDVIVIEGQGSLLNPAYPGGFEILAAGRPDVVILQHAPARRTYDGFPKFPIQPLSRQIEAIEIVSGKPVVAITINHEGMELEQVGGACASIGKETGIVAADVLLAGADVLVEVVAPYMRRSPDR